MKTSAAEHFRRSEIAQLLARYDGLRLIPSSDTTTRIVGTLTFRAEARTVPRIEDSYEIRIEVPREFPERMALVWETGGRIPATYHKLDNAALCLGSRIRLRLKTGGSPSVLRFVERCLVPYLYGYSHFLSTGKMPFGELAHGELGSLQDLAGLLGMEMAPAIPYCALAATKRRRANKRPCPCASGRRLGRCHHRRVNTLRERVGRLVLVKEMETIAAALIKGSSAKGQARRAAPAPTPTAAIERRAGLSWGRDWMFGPEPMPGHHHFV